MNEEEKESKTVSDDSGAGIKETGSVNPSDEVKSSDDAGFTTTYKTDAETDSEKSEDEEPLEYGTMPGSWASYQEEQRQNSNAYRGNGVYPEDGGHLSGGGYFGYGSGVGGGNGSFYGKTQWQNSYGTQEMPKNKKKNILIAALSALCVFLVIALFVGGGYLLNRFSDDLGNSLPSSGESGGDSGQTPGSGGSAQNPGGGTQTTPSTNKEHLQNGGFQLEQVTGEEHYKLSSVYQMTESTVVAIKSTVGSGSGVIISKDTTKNDGYYIVTNNHVIEGGEDIKVTLSSGAVYESILIGRDETTDIAVLKIIASDLSVAKIGKSDDLLVAEEILIIGNPLGTLGGSASNGIVSAKNRVLSIDGYTMTLIQTNAAVNPGNSGGAMFNMRGELVGVVNAKFTDEAVEGIGFAIPIDTAVPVIEDIINYGYVSGRPDLGFKLTYGVNSRIDYYYSYWVTEINTGSDAETAGLKLDDRIMSVSVNGTAYTGNTLPEYLNSLKIGDELKIVVRRYSVTGFAIRYSDVEIEFTVNEYTG